MVYVLVAMPQFTAQHIACHIVLPGVAHEIRPRNVALIHARGQPAMLVVGEADARAAFADEVAVLDQQQVTERVAGEGLFAVGQVQVVEVGLLPAGVVDGGVSEVLVADLRGGAGDQVVAIGAQVLDARVGLAHRPAKAVVLHPIGEVPGQIVAQAFAHVACGIVGVGGAHGIAAVAGISEGVVGVDHSPLRVEAVEVPGGLRAHGLSIALHHALTSDVRHAVARDEMLTEVQRIGIIRIGEHKQGLRA